MREDFVMANAGSFRKGEVRPKRGKHGPPKVTVEFRETVRRLLETNAENVGVWLQMVATGGADPTKADPGKALDLMAKLAEFAAPKLARTEHVGDGGGPVRIIATPEDTSL